jgi:DNA-3-methyladenine glycosylase II
MMLLRDANPISEGLERLARCPLIGPVLNLDAILWERFMPGFQGLVRIVIGQQISSVLADRFWFALASHAGAEDAVTPSFLLAMDAASLKPFALSARKTASLHALASRSLNGDFNKDALDLLSDPAIDAAITAEKGFGLWSSQMYRLFCLARPNVLPRADLVVDRAVMRLMQLDARPDYPALQALCARWEGDWSALTLALWRYEIDARAGEARKASTASGSAGL